MLEWIIHLLSHYVSIGRQFGGNGYDIACIGASICMCTFAVAFFYGTVLPSRLLKLIHYIGVLMLTYGVYKYAFGEVVGVELWFWVLLLSFLTIGVNVTRKCPTIVLMGRISIPRIREYDDVLGINLGMLAHVAYCLYLLYYTFPEIPYAKTITIILLIATFIMVGKIVPKGGITVEPILTSNAYAFFFTAIFIHRVDEMTYLHMAVFIFALTTILLFVADILRGAITDAIYRVKPSMLIGGMGIGDGLIVVPAMSLVIFTFIMPFLLAGFWPNAPSLNPALTPIRSEFDFLGFLGWAFVIIGTYAFLASLPISLITAPITFLILAPILAIKCPSLASHAIPMSFIPGTFIIATIFNHALNIEGFKAMHEEEVRMEMEVLKDLLKEGEEVMIDYIRRVDARKRMVIKLALERMGKEWLITEAEEVVV